MSGYSRGLNGFFIDVAGLPDDGQGLDPSDFDITVGNDDFLDTWSAGPAPAAVGVLPGLGAEGSDRIFVTFDDGALVDTWVRLTLKANGDTNLASDEDFIFGSVPGDTGAAFQGQGVFFGRGAGDLQSIVVDIFNLAGVDNPNDVNRDGRVNAFDLQVIPVASGGGIAPLVLNAIMPSASAGAQGIASGISAVPEPGTAILVLCCYGLLICRYHAKHCGALRRLQPLEAACTPPPSER